MDTVHLALILVTQSSYAKGMHAWQPDTLGPGFESLVLDLGEDWEGPVSATLVRALPPRRPLRDRLLGRERPLENTDVLYLHGWSDYFFQTGLARFFTDRGARFFALDLRKYGRSLRPDQTAGYIENLQDYDAEIELALETMSEGSHEPRKLVLFGHSTGGLVLSLWAARNPGRASALLLNSPWLEFQLSRTGRQLISPLVKLTARLAPHEIAPQLDFGFYTRALQQVGPQEEIRHINLLWRPERAQPVHNGWMSAILEGHEQVSRGLHIEVPIMMLLSSHSAAPLRWNDELTHADTVLEVEEVAKAALKLGSSLTIERIDGALHDVFLSHEDARRLAYARLERWLLGWVAAERLGS